MGPARPDKEAGASTPQAEGIPSPQAAGHQPPELGPGRGRGGRIGRRRRARRRAGPSCGARQPGLLCYPQEGPAHPNRRRKRTAPQARHTPSSALPARAGRGGSRHSSSHCGGGSRRGLSRSVPPQPVPPRGLPLVFGGSRGDSAPVRADRRSTPHVTHPSARPAPRPPASREEGGRETRCPAWILPPDWLARRPSLIGGGGCQSARLEALIG